ncbi:Imidazole glycerol phosphate synthase subunit hisF [Wickerhamomyces ciferrii]|uniref:1-(5-phosphoribosyl)-5-[(5-phosphoribosylamino)methylideneamino] imidazole-4-carboxamide isomerase n=1 Tax=Wickerhamomyces ciferrii (strain ATCC 14091 / BCRC 22168 / CBS 111 / JCM 3599 / NBRC 0793 / NRRL Y-1031 F-60-10) TaxID=1206466 RepID=K0KJK8_WICCF|nr:Imidazole glycerol phosphate synthase subunit hisF [Wickerhamomyces ciferrii]CCH42307.1 Imidazole glycerol phosphate synthase subunit hisF [Wickerhamomyces ciferrii]
MTRFRGCIDIHSGQVKQIVGGTLHQDDTTPTSSSSKLSTNFVSTKPSSYYANLYQQNNVTGTHVIKLGSNTANDNAALEALRTWPNALQIGGGINGENSKYWIEQGASHVIVTSWLFPDGQFSQERLDQLVNEVGKERIVIDLSCRKKIDEKNGEVKWVVAINKWQTITDFELNRENFSKLSNFCDEFLVHAADVEGLCNGIDEELVVKLSEWCDIPITYAGGAKNVNDLNTVEKLSKGKVDLTYGSALDIFGGNLVKFQDCVDWNNNSN